MRLAFLLDLGFYCSAWPVRAIVTDIAALLEPMNRTISTPVLPFDPGLLQQAFAAMARLQRVESGWAGRTVTSVHVWRLHVQWSMHSLPLIPGIVQLALLESWMKGGKSWFSKGRKACFRHGARGKSRTSASGRGGVLRPSPKVECGIVIGVRLSGKTPDVRRRWRKPAPRLDWNSAVMPSRQGSRLLRRSDGLMRRFALQWETDAAIFAWL